jgi:hypothetical protein
MRKIVILMLLVCSFKEVTAQKPKHKRLIEQIAALKVYIDYAQQGYTIANKGLATVRKTKVGDLHLHRDFISSFQTVNAALKAYSRVAAIITIQVRLLHDSKETLKGVREARMFSAAEVDHCSAVINNLLTSSFQNIEALLDIVSDGRLQMKDNERLKRIDLINADMQDKYAFNSSFSEEMALLTVQRMREAKEVDISRILNGLK